MIYFLDNSLQLQKIVTSKNVISAIHEHELNGLIRADVELDLSYANKFLILGIDHVGYYYKDEFYLHKIQRVEYDHVNESAKVVLRHIFFEDMIFGKLIQDVRPQNQDALRVSRQTIDANTRWQTIMTDVTGQLSTNFYWQVPYEVIEFMTKNYRIEYLPKILFDGQKINGFQLHLANKIGEDKNIRIPYGSRVLDLKYEEDYSEIITKLVVHGKGEEVGDGYGRRINISDVNFSRNGVESPVGSLYLEDETITNTYGNDGQTPREGREVFEDIEDANELAEAGYQHYLQVSRPQMLFTADVADIGDVGIGDSVMIIRREYDVYFNARIHKLSVDLLYPEDAQVELGDYEHFKESKVERKTREKNNRVQGQLSDRITRLKQEANERFDNEVAQWKSEYEQALIDVHAEIEADRENMTNLIEGTRTEMTVDFNQTVAESIEYAEQQAQEKADSVQSNLDSFKDSHQQLYDEVTGNLSQTRTDLLERINNIDTQSFNLIRGSRFDEPDRYTTAGGTVHDDEDMPYFRYGISSGNIQYISTVDDVQFEADKTYTLSLDYRTSNDVSIDYLRIIPTDGSADINIRDHITESDMAGIIPDGEWHRAFLTFTVPRNLTGTLRMGSDFSTSVKGQTDIRLPYLTTSGNVQWVFHPSDSYESIISVMNRIDEFEQSVWAELEGVYGNLSSTRTELQNQLDDARAELEGIEYENRNLFVQSSELDRLAEIDDREVLKTRGYFNNSGELASGDPLIIKRNLLSGATYTLSGRFDAPNHPSVPNHNNILLHHENGIINVGKFPPHYENHSFTFRVPENLTQTFLAFDTGVYDAYIEKDTLKLERGKKATPYSKAPEDTEHKITTLNQQIEFIDGQLSAKLEQTDIEPINNKITEYGNSLTANAQSIESLINKTELHDGDITQWSNLTTETAEGLEQTIGRVSTAEGKLSNAEFVIKANADSLKLTATKTEVENAIDGIEVGGRNIIPNSSNLLDWSKWSLNTTVIKMPRGMHRVSRVNPATGGAIGIHSKGSFVLKAGNEYTLSYKAYDFYDALPNYIYILSSEQGNTQLSNVDIKLLGRTGTLVNQSLYANQYKLTFTFTKDVKDGQILIGYNGGTTSQSNIGFYISDVQLEKGNKSTDWSPAPEDTDAEITKWSNTATETAEGLEQTISRVSTAEEQVYKVQTDITANADGLYSLITRVDGTESGIESLSTSLSAEAGKVGALITKTDGHDAQLSELSIDVDGFKTTVSEIEDNMITGFSEFTQTLDGFSQTVGQMEYDIDYGLSTVNQRYDSISSRVANIKLNTRNLVRGTDFEDPEMFQLLGNSTVRNVDGQKSVRLSYREDLNTASVMFMEYVHLKANEDYFLVVDHRSYGTDEFDYLQLQLEDGSYTTLEDADTGEEGFTNIPATGTDWHQSVIRIRLTEPLSGRLRIGTRHNRGTTATNYIDLRNLYLTNTLNREWVPHPRDGQNIDSLVERVSDIEQTADEIRLSVSDSTGLASVLAISTRAMDIISENLNLTGNMNVKGQIESISVSAVRGDIAYLKTNILTSNSIDSNMIQSEVISSVHINVTNALVERIIARNVFANEVNALSLNAVHADLSSVSSRIMETNILKADWIQGGNALLDKVFATSAMFNRMMAKSGFVTALNTVTIDTDQITIRRPDGYQIVNNGVPNWDFSYADTQPRFYSSGSSITGTYYTTSNDVYTTVDATYFQHNTRYVNIRGYAYMYRSTTNPVYGGNVRLSTFGESNNISNTAYISPSENSQGSPMFINLTLDLGKPDGSLRQIYTQTKVSNSDGYDQIRFRRLLLRFHG